MKAELTALKRTVENFTSASVESLLSRLLEYAGRPLLEFNKYDALALTDTLQNRAYDTNHAQKNYYRLVHRTLREKMAVPEPQFQALILRLVGDKDHEKILSITSKVEKQFATEAPGQGGSPQVQRRPARQRYSNVRQLRCYYCRRLGHIRANCPARKSGMDAQYPGQRN